jgi:hypothetical protein
MERFRALNGYPSGLNNKGTGPVERLVTARHGVRGREGLDKQRGDLTSHLFPGHVGGYRSLSLANQKRVDAVAASAVCYPLTASDLERDRPFLLLVGANKPYVRKLLLGAFVPARAGKELKGNPSIPFIPSLLFHYPRNISVTSTISTSILGLELGLAIMEEFRSGDRDTVGFIGDLDANADGGKL